MPVAAQDFRFGIILIASLILKISEYSQLITNILDIFSFSFEST